MQSACNQQAINNQCTIEDSQYLIKASYHTQSTCLSHSKHTYNNLEFKFSLK